MYVERCMQEKRKKMLLNQSIDKIEFVRGCDADGNCLNGNYDKRKEGYDRTNFEY